mgnify:CR=1 FL=1
MTKIFNPTKTPVGVRVNGVHKIIKPNGEADLELTQAQSEKLIRMGLVLSEKDTQTLDIDAPIIGPVDLPQETLTNGQSLDYAFMTDDELRAIVKANGLNVHHKAGRAKLLEALGA